MIKKISFKETYPIRHEVMWPDKDLDYIKVDGDETADHYGYYDGKDLVAVISVFNTDSGYQFRKFATLENYQRRGIGSQLLSYVLDHYQGSIWCNARLEKTAYYKKFGMVQTDRTFIRGNKEYVIMTYKKS